MDNFQKYSRLMLLIAGCFAAFLAFITLIFFILRLFSVTLFYLPGFDSFYGYIVTIIPYLVFYAAYYYLYLNIKKSPAKKTGKLAAVFLSLGLLVCTAGIILTTLIFANLNYYWLKQTVQYTQYPLILQLILVLITAGITASGDVKEKDWMQREPFNK